MRLKFFHNSDMANFMLIEIWLYLSKLWRYTIFNMLKMFIDKNDVNSDGNYNSDDEMVRSHKIFSDVKVKK